MFRPLHLDDAQRASYLRAPAKEGENLDDQERSELSIEFTQLLEQAKGTIAAGHDEVMALGMALAQAIPTMQRAREEVEERPEDDGAGQHDGEDNFGEDQDIIDDRSPMQRDCQGLTSDSAASGGKTLEKQGNRDSSKDGTQVVNGGAEDQGQGDQIDIKAGLDLSFMEDSSSEDDSLATTQLVLEEVEGLDVQRAISTVAEQLTASDTQLSDDGNNQQLQLQQIDTKVVTFRSGDDSKQQDSEDEEEQLGSFISTADVLANEDNLQVVKQERGPLKQRVSELEEGGAQAQPQVMHAEQVVEQKPGVKSVQENLSEGANNLSNRIQKQNEALTKQGQTLRAENVLGAEGAAPAFSKTTEQLQESGIKLMLLRQAFESLRAQRHETNEPKQRQSTPQVGATGATQENKSVSNEGSARGSKNLSRSTTQRMLERVEASLKEAARSRDGKTISLKLDPAQLGRVKVDVTLRDGALHARLTPENQQVFVALREHSQELQSILRKLGLNVDTVTVTVSSDGSKDNSEIGREQTGNGKSFQESRNKMPEHTGQLAENTFGSELAELSAAGTSQSNGALRDHWVA
ncbi:MAG: flagellar hook-length control protein FliK [Proteobacteria bacterium]|nr:flagellar hook-length control protein FliK [Pseudomonadota bacterium]